MNVRIKLISAAVVLPVVISAPTVAAAESTPAPDPSVTEPAPDPSVTEPAPDPTVPVPVPDPTDPAPAETAPAETAPAETAPAETAPAETVDPAGSFGNVPVTTTYSEPRAKRARATKRTSRAGVSMRTRGVRYSPMTAVFRLTQWARKGRSGYRNGCLRLVDDAYGIRHGRTSTALRQWYRAKRAGYGHRNRLAPIGAQLFWRTSNPAGHVATYIGRGMVVTNVGSGRVRIMPWSTINRWGPYLGWAEPYYK